MIAELKTWLEGMYEDREIEIHVGPASSVLDTAIKANLVSEFSTGIVVRDSERIQELVDVMRKIKNSPPRLARWVAYYLLSISKSKSFSIEAFLELVSPRSRIIKVAREYRFALEQDGRKLYAYGFRFSEADRGYRLFLRKGDNLRINPKFPKDEYGITFLSSVSDKLFYSASILRKNRITWDDVVLTIRRKEAELAIKYLSAFMKKQDSGWIIMDSNIERLVEDLDKPLRRPQGEIEDQILGVLDKGDFSNDQLSRLLEADPSTISRAIKRLGDDRVIVGSGGFGEYRRRYWITNCDNCPWDLSKDVCRADSIAKIKAALHEFGLKSSDPDFGKFRNQPLRTLAYVLTEAKELAEGKDYRPSIKELKLLADGVLHPVFRLIQAGKESVDIKDVTLKIAGKEVPLPILYTLGLYHRSETNDRDRQ